MKVGSNTRLLIKNLPLSLDEAQTQRLISQKCKDIGLEFTDCKLLTKSGKGKTKSILGDETVSRGLCFVGFADEADATKFKDFYNGTYFRAAKVTIEYSRPFSRLPYATEAPTESSERIIKRSKESLDDGEVATTLVKHVSKYTKAGVAGERKHTVFDDAGSQDDELLPEDEGDSVAMLPNEDVDPESLDRVVIFNLPYNVTESAIRELCRPFGPITEVHLPLNKSLDTDSTQDKLTKGYCYVTWVFPSDAIKFRDAKNRSIFCGRIIHVDLAKPRKSSASDGSTYDILNRRIRERHAEKSSYKRQLQKKRQSTSGESSIWNTLHIDINATVAAVSRELELQKKEVMDENSAAVNVALTETLVLNELTRWLDEQGIDYKRFQVQKDTDDAGSEAVTEVQRSDDTIIIKNLSKESCEHELVELFSQYGTLMRLSISPYQVMGIVQYIDPKCASTAFKKMAYRPYKGLPIYVEWAPVKLFHEDAPRPVLATTPTTLDPKPTEEVDYFTDTVGDPDMEHASLGSNTSVYIKNLHFKTRNDALQHHFGSCKGYITSKVLLKDNDTLSRGFGFVEFDSLVNAKAAIRAKTGLIIDGKVIEMSIAKRVDKPVAEVPEHKLLKATSKIIVKNLAFQATKQDLYKLFSFYGNVKSVRIPKSLKSNNRGFAFVEYSSKQESARAVESLQHSHLYGRHLVLEFAEEDENSEQE
ncbi:RNA recognition motif domain containing protein [Babesia bovis T2Bo]|uniref:RNA-binding protein P22H7.02c, putative n=1 Tax=Babesia bovis TaxID=5865 RepID=A7AT74_BABBO|nr:RNA recognition motif domain containing protein [Babesia bovis T2Bo]EDO06135.1 RNA recognition motif domain containing protein [Babesia bovis T2Bo]|eukprot:XP_001609703.1 RNA-binding protein P22H7.02c [Babesia bovis T2Bo]